MILGIQIMSTYWENRLQVIKNANIHKNRPDYWGCELYQLSH